MKTTWLLPVLLLAALKIAFGVAGYLFVVSDPAASRASSVPSGYSLLHMVVYGSVALLLILNRGRDRRALWLGSVFVLVAAVTSDRLFSVLPGPAPRLLSHLHPDAFLPLCFWLFFVEFPRTSTSSRGSSRIRRLGLGASALAGVSLFAVHASPLLASGLLEAPLGPLVEPFRPSPRLYLYTWAVVIGLTVPALGYALARVRSAPVQERRRARLFLAGIVAGNLPFWTGMLLRAFWPSFESWLQDPVRQSIAVHLVRLSAMTIPVTTAYAVLVHHVLEVKLVIRQAIQYALARTAVMIAAAVPFAALLVYLYRNRDATISELLGGAGPVFLIAATLLGLVMLQLRQSVLAAIDRRFFRGQYDARHILSNLVEGSRRAESPRDLADLLCAEVDRALHLEKISVLVLETSRGELRDRTRDTPPIPAASALATLVTAQEAPLALDETPERSPFARLPEADRSWIRETGFRLLVPMIASEGTLVGVAALGAKKSELPFSKEDRMLLSTIAASAALTLENRIRVSSPGEWPPGKETGPDAEAKPVPELALECESCGLVAPPESERCRKCEGSLRRAAIPMVLGGKFRFDRRIGSGGMGVVYRGVDLTLGRRVAIKTLPRISIEFASRLRREARAMAAVTHPNLSLVYAVESWLGSPVLIVELLEGGTLASRLRAGRLDLEQGLELGLTLASVLETIHDAGVLHRDIKPSNVGYTSAGVPKLLDFGLAKILDDARASRFSGSGSPEEDLEEIPPGSLTVLTVTRCIVGTPIYLSPEAVRGFDPDERVDLWALAVTLFEALSGLHPLRIQETSQLRRRILEGEVDDIAGCLAGCPESLRAFFATALARDPGVRPRTAAEFRDRLREVG